MELQFEEYQSMVFTELLILKDVFFKKESILFYLINKMHSLNLQAPRLLLCDVRVKFAAGFIHAFYKSKDPMKALELAAKIAHLQLQVIGGSAHESANYLALGES